MGTDREADKQKIKQILTATIVSLCNNGLSFESELCVEGLLGITLDRKDVLLVSIKETINGALKKKPKPAESQSQGGRQSQTTPNKQQQQQQKLPHLQQQQQQQQQYQQQTTPRKQQPPQQTPQKQKQHVQEQPRTPGKPSSSAAATAAAQDSFGHVKPEPSAPKVMSESQTQCMAVQPYGGGYAQVQKSVKMVQNAQGVVEQKQVEWKTYTADGRVVEHKKVQEVQTVAPSSAPTQNAYAGQPMQNNISAAMPGYPASNIKLEPGCEEDLYGQQDPDMYYEEEPGYDDYNCMADAYNNAGQEAYMAGGYQVPGQQYDPNMDSMGELYHQLTGPSRGRGGGTKRPLAKRPKKEKMATGKVPAIKKTAKPPQMVASAAGDNPVSRNTPAKGTSKEVNNSLVQRALDMVHEGKLSASTAINLFGIPKSTFYKKLATSNAEKGQQFLDEADFEGMEEGWDDGMQGVYDPMDPAFANYSA